jgi:hypothetical protein
MAEPDPSVPEPLGSVRGSTPFTNVRIAREQAARELGKISPREV